MPIQFYYFWDGKGMNYGDSFVLTYSQDILVLSGFIIIPIIILSAIIFYIQRLNKQKVAGFDSLNYQQFDSQNAKHSHFKLLIFLEIINELLIWTIFILTSLIFTFSSSYELIPDWVAGFLMFCWYLIGLSIQIFRLTTFKIHDIIYQRILQVLKQFKYLILIQSIILITFSIILPLLLSKGCLCVYNTGYGIEVLNDLQYSTYWIRSYWIDQVCNDDKICHIYATLPQQANSQVFINIQTGINLNDISININDQNVKCDEFNFPRKVEKRGQRRIYSCYIHSLTPNTLYQFNVLDSQQNIIKTQNYKTPPLNEQLTIMFGGDWGYRQAGVDLVSTINQVNPDIILIGGDVAYDNGMVYCYYSWDLFLDTFEQEFNEINRIIPFIFSPGNHDVGFNDNANYNITVSDENGPLYFTYFPQFVDQNNKIPQIKDRHTYQVHQIQKLAIFGLDSGYLYLHDQQVEWIKQMSQQHQNLIKIAHYHVPLYPSCFNNNTIMGKWEDTIKAQNAWVPIFDEYQFAANFENHVHQFKRTHPLKNNQKVEKGTVYFGDGSMGVRSLKCQEHEQTYKVGGVFEGLFDIYQTENSEHFWVVKIEIDGTLQFIAYDPKYNTIEGSEYQINYDL